MAGRPLRRARMNPSVDPFSKPLDPLSMLVLRNSAFYSDVIKIDRDAAQEIARQTKAAMPERYKGVGDYQAFADGFILSYHRLPITENEVEKLDLAMSEMEGNPVNFDLTLKRMFVREYADKCLHPYPSHRKEEAKKMLERLGFAPPVGR